MVAFYLILMVMCKWKVPTSKKFIMKDHSNLIAGILSGAADVVDIVEYTTEQEIVNAIGINVLCGEPGF